MLANGKIDVCYNMQTAVDAKHKLIVAFEVTSDGNDKNHLTPMAVAAEENRCGRGKSRVDTGYDSVQDIVAGMEAIFKLPLERYNINLTNSETFRICK
jgi:hypothetical protein